MLTVDELKERAAECLNRDECLFCSWFKDVWCDRKVFARETLETIKHLEAAAPKWISVEERLPGMKAVIAINTSGEMLIGLVSPMSCGDLYKCDSEGDVIFNVTHWRPLPEPPEEE